MTSASASPRSLRLAARSIALLFVLVALGGIALAWAGAPPSQDGAAPPSQDAAAEDAPPGATPRSALRAYLAAVRAGDYAEAARYLDLSQAEAEPGTPAAADLARELDVVLKRTVWLDPALVSDESSGDLEDDLEPGLERVGAIPTGHGEVPILLSRRDGAEPAWRFAPYTVAAIPALYEEHGYGWIEEVLPRTFFDVVVLDVELWQWVGLLLAVFLASFLGFAAAFAIVFVLRILVKRTKNDWDDWMVDGSAGPLRFGFSLFAFWLLSHVLALGVGVQGFVDAVCEALAVLAVTWLILNAIDVVARLLHHKIAARDASAADTLVPMGRRITKVFVLALAVISMVHNLGFNAAGLLTGLGVGGLAFALAAQKTIENLFGGISVIADKPIEVGQFCKVGDHIGTIESIGLRSTRIRTLDRTLVTVPNAEFSTVRIESYAARDRMRLYTVLQVGYDTSPDQLRWILVELRKLLLGHPRVLRDPARVRFVAFNSYSLDLEVFAYVDTSDWNEFLGIREDVYLRMIDVVAASGAYFAYPSQTLYLGRDGGRDPERTEEAEAAVRAMREASKLPLPNFPESEVASLAGTLAFPPEGSATAGG